MMIQTIGFGAELFAFFICLIFAIALMHLEKAHKYYNTVIVFGIVVSLVLLSDLFDRYYAYLVIYNHRADYVMHFRITECIDYSLLVLETVALHFFVISVIEERGGIQISRPVKFLVWQLGVLSCFYWIASLWTGRAFIITDSCRYIYGPDYPLIELCLAATPLFDIGLIIANRKKIKREYTFSLISFVLLPLICQLLQFYVGTEVLPYLAYSISLVHIFVVLSVERDIENATQSRIIMENRTRLMISQIRPHFLMNSLTSIMDMCETNPGGVSEALADFGDYLRCNIDSLGKNELESFSTELEHTKCYVRLEKLRFGDIINVEYDILEKDFYLPVLTLQPLVENAIKHGVAKKKTGGTIKISSYRQNGEIVVSVEDDGVGFDTDILTDKAALSSRNSGEGESTHIGINNVRERLAICCDAELIIDSQPGQGTVTRILLP